jgi:hypothetical protein
MSDWKLPDLPSDEELGITDEDREKYGEELPSDGPEFSEEEMAALFGEAPGSRLEGSRQGAAPEGGKKSGGPADDAKAAKRRAKEEKERAKAEKKQEKKRAKAEERKAREEEKRAKADKRKAREEEKRAGAESSVPGSRKTTAASTGPATVSAEPDNETRSTGRSGNGGAGGRGAEAAQSGGRSRWRGPLTLAALIITAAVASTRTGLPRPVPASAADTLFSSARAMSTLVDLARRAHPTGSPEHERVRALVVERLRALDLDPEVQTTTSVIERTGYARAATVRNVIARMPGTDPTGTVLVTAHYDSRELAVGAGDDGSGVVAIIEAVRALRAFGPIRNDLIVLFTDAEELGLLGARAFVNQHPLMDEVDLVLSFEMRGGGGPSIMFETNELNGWVVRAIQEWDPKPYANSMAYEVYQRMPNDTDFTPFREAGVQGLNFAAVDDAHVYHQVYDTPENLSEATLQHHGRQALGALRHFGSADLDAVNASDVVYFSVTGLGLVIYDEIWVLPISLAVILLFALLAFVALRTGARPRGMMGGLVVAVLASALSFALAWGLLRWLPRVHEEWNALHGGVVHSEGWYMLALAFGVLAIVSAVTSATRRWLSLVELSVGALVLPALAAVVAGFVTPLAAMNLQWPVIAGLLSTLVVTLLGRRGESVIGWVAVLLLALPVVIVLQPVVELVWLGMSLRLAGVLAVMIATGMLLFVPALSALRHPNAWWAPATGLTVVLVATGVGLLAGRPSAERPSPSTLLYAYEHGTGDALWITAPSEEGSLARAWAAEKASAGFGETRDLSAFGIPWGETPVASAPVVDAQPPAVAVVADTLVQGERRVVMEVRSRIGAELLQFHVDDRTRLELVNGVELSEPALLRLLDHWGQPEGNVVLELSMPAGEPIGVHVVEHLFRPGELVGRQRFERPADLAPNVVRMSDRALFRYSVADFADPRHAIVPGTPPDSSEAPLHIRTPPPNTGVPSDSLVIRRDTLATDTTSADTIPRDTMSTRR